MYKLIIHAYTKSSGPAPVKVEMATNAPTAATICEAIPTQFGGVGALLAIFLAVDSSSSASLVFRTPTSPVKRSQDNQEDAEFCEEYFFPSVYH